MPIYLKDADFAKEVNRILLTSLRLYVYTINLLGLGLVAYAMRHFPYDRLLDGLIFLLFASVVQMMPVMLKRDSNVSVSWALAYASVLLLGPEAGVLACTGIGLVASFIPERLHPQKMLFNVGANAAPAYAAGLVLQAVAGWQTVWLFQFVIVPLLYFALNASLVLFAISLATKEPPVKIFNQNYRWLSINYLALAPIGYGLYKAYELLNVLGLLIFLLPLVMARYSFKLYIDQTQKVEMHVASLERANHLLERKVDEVAALQKHALLMGGSLNVESALRAVFEPVAKEVPYRTLHIVRKNDERGGYDLMRQSHDGQIHYQTVAELETDMKRAFYHGKRVVLPYDEKQVTLLCPMIAQGEVKGVMTLLCSCELLEEIDSSLDVYVAHAAAALENAILFDRAEKMACTDNLTKLYNRHYLGRKLAELKASGRRPVTVIVMDFDNFKDINNTYGHHVGDLTLHHVAALIREEVREGDIPVRYGGDEYAVLLPDATEEMGLIVGTRLLERIRQPVTFEGHSVSIGLSIGVASCTDEHGDLQETIKQADKAAYVSKAQGKGCLTLYSQLCCAESQDGHDCRAQEEIVEAFTESDASRSITKGLLQVLLARDVDTYHHSLQVATYAVWLAEEIGLCEAEVERIRTGALLHDIGKLGISDEVLNKRSGLSEPEIVCMRTHPVVGYELLTHFGNVYTPILPIVLSHHERIDGCGYPHQAAAATLEVGVCIVSIADAFDSMTREKAYRGRLPFQWAVEELHRCAGTQFDAELVGKFAQALKRHVPEQEMEATGDAGSEGKPLREALLQ